MRTAERTEGIAVLCDPLGRIQEVVHDDLGVADRVERGQSLTTLVDPPCLEKTQAFLQALRAQNAAFNWELNVPVRDGRVESLHFAGGAADGGFLVVGARSRSHHYDDLSRLNNDLATAQRDLAKSNAELSRLNDQKNQFLGMAAHDLRNPLEVILTYSDFLLDEAAPSLPREQVAFIETIRSSSELMLHLVESLLDLARIESGKLELDLERVDLQEIAASNAARNRVLAAKKGIEIHLHQEGGPLEMLVDRVKIEQVLNNLIGNAVKFSPPGSPVDVRVTPRDGHATVAVEDRGPGIPAEELDKLFRPFARTRVRSTAGEKGAGLGLAIVKRIVEGHGGEIRVESEPGRGSVFHVSLPKRGLEGRWPGS